MENISIPAAAFSHGQIKSKLWLIESFNRWSDKYLPNTSFVLNWYGSWVGIGPFMLLSQAKVRIHEVNLFDIDAEALATSVKLLEQWYVEGITLHAHCLDVNNPPSFHAQSYLFVNTSCEHMTSWDWLDKIPEGAFILLQSTNMKHPEHVNRATDLADFVNSVEKFAEVFETDQMHVSYADSSFSRFMVFGKRK